MPSLFIWFGLGLFAIGLSWDFYTNWLDPRLKSKNWFPREPDLPAVAGDVEADGLKGRDRVLLATYFPGIAILLIGTLDASSVNPACLPYSGFLNHYIVRAFGLTTGLMWYSEGQGIEIPYHGEIRYTLGILTVVIPLYIDACGKGVL